MAYLIIFLGGGIGSALRHAVNIAASQILGAEFPYGTLIINIVGSFLMGVIAGYFAFMGGASQNWRLFLTTGVLGGFTTFSTFSLETVLLYHRGDYLHASFYVLASLGLGVGGLIVGMSLVRHFS